MTRLLEERKRQRPACRLSVLDVRRGDSATIGVPHQLVNRNPRQWPWGLFRQVTVLILVGLAARHPAAQSHEPLTEARVRALARRASRDSRGDPTDLVLRLDQRVREQWGDFESFPLSIVRDDDLLVAVTAPYMSFRSSLVEMLRSGRPIEHTTWTETVVIEITPRRLSAPDVESVVISRDGRTVVPVKNALRPMTFSNGRGDQGVIHAGAVHFAVSAFSPGGTVVLTLAPRGVDPIRRVFSDAELSTLR